MGYEIKIIYHPKSDDGYDLTKAEEKTRKIGKAIDQPDDARLAQEILKQFSRRDIFVKEIEVVEFVRKPLKIRTARNGNLVIRGKKYSLDTLDGPAICDVEVDVEIDVEVDVEVDEPSVVAQGSKPAQPAQPASVAKAPPKKEKRVLRREIFDPDPKFASLYKGDGFVVGKEYDILEEVRKGQGEFSKFSYRVKKEDGTEILLPAEFFTPLAGGLSWIGDTTTEEEASVKLDFGGGGVDPSMPSIRTG